MAHVFISYVHENKEIVDRLVNDLTQRGIEVWLDRTMINPGQNWKVSIAKAIDKGDFFLACFSKEYGEKKKSYMNEEISLAIEQLRRRGDDTNWFIPVLLSGEIPNRYIDASRKLTDIQWVELNEHSWDKDIQRILRVIPPSIHLRSNPIKDISYGAAREMLQERGFFDLQRNRASQAVLHQYEERRREGQSLIIDNTTSLTWQRSGSHFETSLEEAYKYIQTLNSKQYAGYDNWRLPTLDEAMSLMEPNKNKDGMYIDPIFDSRQNAIWTADRHKKLINVLIPISYFEERERLLGIHIPPPDDPSFLGKELVPATWVANFENGCCDDVTDEGSYVYVRSVRSDIVI